MMRWPAGVGAIALLSSCVAPREAAPPPLPVAAAPVPVAPPAPALVLEGGAQQGARMLGRVTGAAALALDGERVATDADGRFMIAFDRDAAATARLVATNAGGGVVAARDLAVAPGDWRIERVDAPYRAGKTDAEFAAARPAELARIAAARATPTDADGWRQAFRWPANGRQSGWFGAGRLYQGQPGGYHSGADVAVPTGTPVVAPADGVVILAAERPFTLEGNLLMIDHGMGMSTALLHLARIDVRVGARVRQGQPVALSGATGRVSGPHLHWGLQWRGRKLDPVKVVGAGPAG